MKILILVTVAFILFSCKEKKDKEYSPEVKLEAKRLADSLVNNIYKNVSFDTVGVAEAPVKVLSARLFKEEYSNYKSISLTYKNVSGKRIEAMKFKWYGEDAFGDPADMGSAGLTAGFGGGFDDNPIGPGQTRTSTWSIYSSRGKKVVKAWPYEVKFSDGNSWKSQAN